MNTFTKNNQIIDQNNDRNQQYFISTIQPYYNQLLNKMSLPSSYFIKTSSFPPSPTHTITIYSDPINKKFPCNTPQQTLLSCLYFHHQQNKYNEKHKNIIKNNFYKFASYFNIKDKVDQILNYQQIKNENHNLLNKLPIHDVQKGINWLQKYGTYLPYPVRQKISVQLIDYIKENNINVPDKQSLYFLHKVAGYGVGSCDEIKKMVQYRIKMSSHDPILQQKLQQIYDILNTNPQQILNNHYNMLKLSHVIDKVDKINKINKNYGNLFLLPPEQVIFKYPLIKISETVNNVISFPSGNIYNIDDLKQMKLNEIKEHFGGDEFVSLITNDFGNIDVEKLKEQVKALPVPDSELFEKILKNQGILPFAQKESNDKQSFSLFTDQQFTQFAEKYNNK